MVQVIDRATLEARLAGPTAPVLIEALPARYYVEAHLPGAINIPHDAIDELAPRVLPDRTAPIVVYCANGPCRNSGIAAERLAALGYTDVADYHAGKADWRAAGGPLLGTGAAG
jgi:rhodanese-related sulfurtransferase